MTRRTFLATTGVGSLAAAAPPLRSALAEAYPATGTSRFKGPFGLELYSVRHQLEKDIPGTLAMVREIGYTEVEAVYDNWGHATAQQLGDEVKRAGLKLPSLYYPDGPFQNHLDEIIEAAHHGGAEYLICGNVPGAFQNKPLTLDDFKRGAAAFNQWAEKVRAAGLRFGYHNHNYEFRLYDGKPAYDTLIGETQPGLVDFEMDIFWVKCGDQDAAAYLKRYPKRFRLVHLKDVREGTPIGDFTANISEEASVTLGAGILDIPAILREAAAIGIERYYVEDESAEAPQDIRLSLAYLKQVRF
jgi:sugar phosphate isomerase/epimerase